MIEESGAAAHVWRPPATLSLGVLTLTYPDPADGTIVETYTRQ